MCQGVEAKGQVSFWRRQLETRFAKVGHHLFRKGQARAINTKNLGDEREGPLPHRGYKTARP